MVTNNKMYIPSVKFSGQAHGRRTIHGKGASVLLQKGGPGGASSYSGLDDYIATTGNNPMSGKGLIPSMKEIKGFSRKVVNETKPSLEKFGKKLESLTLKVPKPNKIKNIRFNL